ncbi:MAG: hypothetical protein HQ558_05480 [Candidatus Omnitrophica bacterium]|nr:hypothetical protein [Candidatus Omnitrophota bacterium]
MCSNTNSVLDYAPHSIRFALRPIAKKIADEKRFLYPMPHSDASSPTRIATTIDAFSLLSPNGTDPASAKSGFGVRNTGFFDPRHKKHFAIEQVARMRKDDNGKIRILSAATATGQEAYNAAIALVNIGISAERIEIIAMDRNSVALHIGCIGVYPFNLDPLGHQRLSNYESNQPSLYEIDRSKGVVVIGQQPRDCVRFVKCDLEEPSFLAVLEGPFDLIICSRAIEYLSKRRTKVLNDLIPLLSERGLLYLEFFEPSNYLEDARENAGRHGLEETEVPAGYRLYSDDYEAALFSRPQDAGTFQPGAMPPIILDDRVDFTSFGLRGTEADMQETLVSHMVEDGCQREEAAAFVRQAVDAKWRLLDTFYRPTAEVPLEYKSLFCDFEAIAVLFGAKPWAWAILESTDLVVKHKEAIEPILRRINPNIRLIVEPCALLYKVVINGETYYFTEEKLAEIPYEMVEAGPVPDEMYSLLIIDEKHALSLARDMGFVFGDDVNITDFITGLINAGDEEKIGIMLGYPLEDAAGELFSAHPEMSIASRIISGRISWVRTDGKTTMQKVARYRVAATVFDKYPCRGVAKVAAERFENGREVAARINSSA